MTVAFAIPVRVYYEDTDAGGVVYYANYLRFMERCRSDWLRSAGLEIRDIAARHGLLFAVRAANVEYIKPAQLSDLLTVSVLVLIRKSIATATSSAGVAYGLPAWTPERSFPNPSQTNSRTN